MTVGAFWTFNHGLGIATIVSNSRQKFAVTCMNWAVLDLNQQPPRCKRGALPIELTARMVSPKTCLKRPIQCPARLPFTQGVKGQEAVELRTRSHAGPLPSGSRLGRVRGRGSDQKPDWNCSQNVAVLIRIQSLLRARFGFDRAWILAADS